MKAGRILLTLLAVGVAAWLAFRGATGRTKEEAVAPAAAPPPATPGEPAPFPTLDGGTPPAAAPAAAPAPAAPRTEPPAVSDDDPAPGTPVKDGAEVSVVVPYRAGTKSRYRVSDATLQKDRETNAVQAWQFVWDVSTEVVAGDGTGAARIRLRIDSFEFDTTDVMGRPVKVRSKEADKTVLADEQFGRGLKPVMAILGMPVEFVIGPAGEIASVEGATGLNRAFADAVDALGAKFSADLSDAPTTESLTQKWSEILFPPLGGGALKAGADRAGSFRTTYYERWCSVAAGKFRVTNDDPGAFRVAFKGKPEIEEMNRPAKWPGGVSVAKVRVVSSADSYTGAWRFDRTAGRLAWGTMSAKFRVDVSRATPGMGTGYEAHFTDVERRIVTELLDK